MNPTTLLAEARACLVELTATPEGNLRWRCEGPLPDGFRQQLAEHKEALVHLLAQPTCLLVAFREDLAAIERRDFRGAFPPALRTILADCLAVLDSYASDPAAVAARGKNPVQEIRDGWPWLLSIIARATQQEPRRVAAG